jgi:hypothetical protein
MVPLKQNLFYAPNLTLMQDLFLASSVALNTSKLQVQCYYGSNDIYREGTERPLSTALSNMNHLNAAALQMGNTANLVIINSLHLF